MSKFKRIRLKIIVLASVIMIVMIQSVIAATTGTINSDTVRVRKSATTESAIVAYVFGDEKVEILEKTGDWYKITCKYEGKTVTGYVRSDLIDVKDSTKVEEKPIEQKPVEEKPIEQKPVEEKPIEQKPVEEKPIEQKPVEEKPIEQKPVEEKPTEQPTPDKIIIFDNSLKTLKVNKEQLIVKSNIKISNDVNLKILPVISSTNIATITSGTDVTVLEIVNNWVRLDTKEFIGWARID